MSGEHRSPMGLASAPVGAMVASASAEGPTAWINAEFTHLTGYGLEDVPTVAAWLERAHPDPLLRRRVRQAWPFTEEVVHKVRCADGAVKEILFRASLLGDQSLVLLLDVTEQARSEEALRRSQERYALAARAGDIGVWELWPLQGRIFGDANLARLMELEPREMSEDFQVWLESFPYEDARHIRSLVVEILAGEREQFEFEHRAIRRDGEERWFAVSGRVVEPGAVNPRIVGASRDVTRWRRAQQALEESEARYRSLVESSPVGIVLHKEGKVLFANSVARELLCGDHDPTGDAIMDYVHPDHRERVAQRVGAVYAGETDRLDLIEERFVHRDGTVIEVEVAGAAAWYRGERASQVVIADISARRRAEEALRRSEQRYALAQRAAGLASWEWDVDADVLQFSDGAPALYGTLPGHPVVTLDALYQAVHPEDRERLREATRACVAEGAEYDIEYRVVHPDGAVRWLRATGDAVREDGRATRMLGVVSDITERVVSEQQHLELAAKVQQAQRMESLALLAGGVAHDFNNLLMGILGHADLALLELPSESSARRNIRGIERAAQRAADLARQMLAYSGRGRFVVDQVDLGALVQEMAQLLEASISKKARLTLAFTPGLPAIEADATQLRQVVMNLITNAGEALPEGGGTVTVSTGSVHCTRETLDGMWLGAELEPGRYAWLEVSDDGEGMDRHTLSRIFDPFFTTKFTGRGLGLAAVLGIVRGHGGALEVQSTPGVGTRFRVFFPAPDAPSVEPRPDEGAPTWRGRGTILLVDDEETVRSVVGLMLERAGFDVAVAADGHQALEAYQEHREQVAAVVLDLTMPGMDGVETLRALRALDPGVQVILSSGYDHAEVAQLFPHQPGLRFIQKPYTYAELLRTLRDALGPDPVEE